MALFDGPYTIFYWLAIVSIAIFCSTFKLLNNIMILKTGLEVTRVTGIAQFGRSHTSYYWYFIVTMALSCVISETKQDIGRKSQFFHTPLHSTPTLWRSLLL